jgi:hypothetical protein
MTLRNNDTQALRLRNKTVQRIAFIVNLISGAAAGTLASILLENVNVKIVLRRKGKEYTIANDGLHLLSLESMYYQGFQHVLDKSPVSLSDNYKMLPLMIDLGTPLNLKEDDELSVEVNTKPGWMGDFDPSSSSIEVEDREAIGVEVAIPYIKTRPISATHNKATESLGKNVTSIMLANTESDRDNSDAKKVFESLMINSDKYNATDNRGRLLSRRATQFANVSDALARKENFRYVPAVELDDVEVIVELNAAQVAPSKNFIIFRQYEQNAVVIDRANTMISKHASRRNRKIGEAKKA